MNRNVLYALAAAGLFGASTPFAKLFTGDLSPILLARLLNLGSGVGLAVVRLIRDRSWDSPGLAPGEWPWLIGAIFFGGILAPVALLYGLIYTSGSAASLLLSFEAVLTAVIAGSCSRKMPTGASCWA